jgi:hypothetical protein
MLIRILVDHPGASFTRNFDAKFVNTIKTFLREGRDVNAQAMLRETLHAFEVQRQWDESLKELLAMWRRENERSKKSGTQKFVCHLYLYFVGQKGFCYLTERTN